MMLAQSAGAGAKDIPMRMPVSSGDSAPMMDTGTGALPNKVGFPYGFPTPGKYRIFVQMKHGDTIETGSFDANVPQ
jgi:hypothetical protein